MKISSLQNEQLCVSIKHHGAELSSLKKGDTEYMWQANPKYWGRHAPVLFPIIGELKGGKLTFKGASYTMKRHGLARNLPFELIEETENQLTFSLKSSAATLENYPFEFELQISYTLIENTLTVGYKVINPSEATIYFSIGGHPAFNVPLHEDEKRSDYQLVFNQKENASTQRLTDGLRNGVTEQILDNENVLPITDDLFEKDALVFKYLNSTTISIQKGEQKILTFDFKGFPYLGIWSSSKDAPFVCIEPWLGVADHIAHNQDITKKEGIIELDENNTFEHSYRIIL